MRSSVSSASNRWRRSSGTPAHQTAKAVDMPITWVSGSDASTRSRPARRPHRRPTGRSCSRPMPPRRPRDVSAAAFGTPVVPDVVMRTASSPGSRGVGSTCPLVDTRPARSPAVTTVRWSGSVGAPTSGRSGAASSWGCASTIAPVAPVASTTASNSCVFSRGLTGTATAPSRASASTYRATSIRLPVATRTRPVPSPASRSAAASRPTCSSRSAKVRCPPMWSPGVGAGSSTAGRSP
jgi:hypothetical protein